MDLLNKCQPYCEIYKIHKEEVKKCLKIKGIKPQGKPWTRFKRNDPAASGRGIENHNKQALNQRLSQMYGRQIHRLNRDTV